MKKPAFIIGQLIVAAATIYAQQSDFPKLSEPYLGQKPPGTTPEIFASGIISSDQFEFGITFSPRGEELFFTRRPDYNSYDNRIYHILIKDGVWTKPQLATFANNVFEFLPVVLPDGKSLIFYSERGKPDGTMHTGNLWISKKEKGGWTEAVFFDSPANFQFCMMVSAAKTGTIYYAGVINGKRGIFGSTLVNGRYSAPEYLPDEVNYLKPNHPFVSPDENYLIMDAQLSGMGKQELFISFKKDDGSWTKAVNMGQVINATKTEFGASISPDGKYLFFHRRVDGNGDIYWVSAKVIEELRPKE
jgi:Tol biopolymer transport system component